MRISHYLPGIQSLCLSEPQTVNQIFKFLGLTDKQDFVKLYNFFNTKTAKEAFYIEKDSGLLFIRTNPLFYQNLTRLDLSKQNGSNSKKPLKIDNNKTYKNFNESRICNSKHYKKIDIKRASPERFKAALKLNRVKDFGYYDKNKKEFIYTNTLKQEIEELFNSYCSRTKKEKIIMCRAPDGDPVFAQDISFPYKTRFTDPGRQKQNIEGFENAYKKASSRHMKGVLLTLTASPKGSNTLWEANTKTRKAWKNFSKFLNKSLPDRAEWIKVTEFQQNGRIHYHVLVFGVNWIALKSVIQYAWVKYGGGSIIDIHTIKQIPGKGWHWSKSSPSDSAGRLPGDYLRAYLSKSMTKESGAMYWATGVRNWTASKSLLPEKLKAQKPEPLQSPTKRYFFKGVISALTGFRSSHRKDSISLFSGSLKAPPAKPSKPPKERLTKHPTLSLSFRKATDLSYQC